MPAAGPTRMSGEARCRKLSVLVEAAVPHAVRKRLPMLSKAQRISSLLLRIAVMEQTGERVDREEIRSGVTRMAILLAIRSRLINEKRKGVLWVFWAENIPAFTA